MNRYAELYGSWRWQVPARYNIAQACCGRWAVDRSRFALYWEDESGETAKGPSPIDLSDELSHLT